MSEYWVSRKKYFCKYCDIYIADDAPSRQQHENGMRHKGNKDRFVRGLYKAGEKRQKDLAEEKRDMARVEQAAQAAFAQDVGAGLAKPIAPVASTSKAPSKPPPKPSNPFANYSTAQSLGYDDPDAERIASANEQRRSQGLAGEWEAVALPPPPEPVAKVEPDTESVVAGVKREAEGGPEEEDTRQFKLRKKKLQYGLGELYDPGIIPIKLKNKEEDVRHASSEPSLSAPVPTSSGPQATEAPTWTTMQWKRAGEIPQATSVSNPKDIDVKPEPQAGDASTTAEPTIDIPVKSEETQEPVVPKASGGMFRKRKTPTAGSAVGKRQ